MRIAQFYITKIKKSIVVGPLCHKSKFCLAVLGEQQQNEGEN